MPDDLRRSQGRAHGVSSGDSRGAHCQAAGHPLAYELGRSLRDTVNPPLENAADQDRPCPALARQFGRERIARLQEWLATLSAQFPQHAAAVVATSLGRWSELSAATSTQLRKGDGRTVATAMCEYLLPQGDVWLLLLTGARSASGLLSPEAYVAAGEVALRRSAAIAPRDPPALLVRGPHWCRCPGRPSLPHCQHAGRRPGSLDHHRNRQRVPGHIGKRDRVHDLAARR